MTSVAQCQQSILDVASKLSAEKRDRDQDFDQVTSTLFTDHWVSLTHITISEVIRDVKNGALIL